MKRLGKRLVRFLSRVFLAWNISCVYGRLLSAHDGVNAAEDEVCLFVSALAFPPSFNHSLVVSLDFEVSTAAAG